MSVYDVTPDEEPLDLAAVSDDDALVEQLRRSLSPQGAVVWDDDVDDDPGFALLRLLQRDVAAGLPEGGDLPADVVPLSGRPRRFGRTATVTAIAAGVLSLGGVAAAASSPGTPLGDVRSAVASAVGNVVDAITPSTPIGPTTEQPAAEAPRPKATPAGQLVSAAARSASATTQINGELDRAESFLDAKKYAAAGGQLDTATRKLPLVLDATTQHDLATRLLSLRERLATEVAARPHSTQTHSAVAPAGKRHSGRPADTGTGRGSEHATPSHSPAQTPPTHRATTGRAASTGLQHAVEHGAAVVPSHGDVAKG